MPLVSSINNLPEVEEVDMSGHLSGLAMEAIAGIDPEKFGQLLDMFMGGASVKKVNAGDMQTSSYYRELPCGNADLSAFHSM